VGAGIADTFGDGDFMTDRNLTRISSAILLASVLGGALEAQEKRLIETEDMFAMRSVGAPVVSPDGEWIAYPVGQTSLDEERSFTRIFMSPADGGDPVGLTADGKSAGSPGWSPDGRYFTFTASRDGGDNQVWALDRRGGEGFPLTEVEGGISGYRWSPDGTRLLLTIRDPEEEDEDRKANAPQDPWVIDRLQFKRDNAGYLTGNRKTHLYVYELASESLRQLTSGQWDESLGVWSPDGSRIAFVSNRTAEPDGNANSDIWIVSADLETPTDTPTRVTTNEGSDGSPAWSPDGRSIAYTTGIRPDLIWYATTHLAVVPVDGGEPRLLTTDLDRNVSRPRFSDDGRWIWFRLEDSGENHIARIRMDGSDLERPVSGGISAGGFDWAGGTFAASVSTLDHPGEIYRVDGPDDGTAELRRVTGHNDDFLSMVRIAETRNVQFQSPDGTPVEGFVTFPPDYVEGQRYPTLLRIHGGPVSQFSHSFQFESQLFAANGYLVVRTNPRGSSGYGQDFSAALWANWGTPDFQDVMAGVDYAIEQGWADPGRLGVGGWSYGGILTNYVITQTDRFEGAITGASEVLYIANYGHDHYQRQWEAELGLPWEGDNRDNWERINRGVCQMCYGRNLATMNIVDVGEAVGILAAQSIADSLRGNKERIATRDPKLEEIRAPRAGRLRLVELELSRRGEVTSLKPESGVMVERTDSHEVGSLMELLGGGAESFRLAPMGPPWRVHRSSGDLVDQGDVVLSRHVMHDETGTDSLRLLRFDADLKRLIESSSSDDLGTSESQIAEALQDWERYWLSQPDGRPTALTHLQMLNRAMSDRRTGRMAPGWITRATRGDARAATSEAALGGERDLLETGESCLVTGLPLPHGTGAWARAFDVEFPVEERFQDGDIVPLTLEASPSPSENGDC